MVKAQGEDSRIARGYPGEPKGSLLRRILTSDLLQVLCTLVAYILAASLGFLLLTWLVYDRRYGITLTEYLQMLF